MTDWRDRARELVAAGVPVNAVCREVGKSEHAVRFNLNINGRADRYRAAHGVGVAHPAVAAPEQSLPQVRLATITLPAISLPDISEPAKPVRLAPKVRSDEKPGVERWRATHQAMKRAGKIRSNDVLSEWLQ